ncbi:hypothetical protein [Streptomyces sp. NPDC000994]
MQTRVRAIASTAVVLALGLGVSTATASADDRGSQMPRTIPVSEADFVAGVMATAGLSASEAHELYEDPEQAQYVPYEEVATDEAIGGTVDTPEEGVGPALVEVKRWCEITAKRDYNNAFGNRLFRYTMVKYWEGNNSTVSNPHASVSHSTTTLGSIGGWSYDKQNGSNDYYFISPSNGPSRGGHYSYRSGQWKTTSPTEYKTRSAKVWGTAHMNWKTDASPSYQAC